MKHKKQILLTSLFLILLIVQTISIDPAFFVDFYDNLEPSLTYIFPLLFIIILGSLVYFFREGNKYFNKIFRVLIYILLIINVYKFLSEFPASMRFFSSHQGYNTALSIYYSLASNLELIIFIALTLSALYIHKLVTGKFKEV